MLSSSVMGDVHNPLVHWALDGNGDDVPTDAEPAVGGKTDALTTVIIGRAAKDADGAWDGLIDDVYIYAEALSAEDI